MRRGTSERICNARVFCLHRPDVAHLATFTHAARAAENLLLSRIHPESNMLMPKIEIRAETMENTFDNNSKNSRILMIDDDIKLCHLVKDYLSPRGFAVNILLNKG